MLLPKVIWDHPYTFWTMLRLPAIPMILELTSGAPDGLSNVLHP